MSKPKKDSMLPRGELGDRLCLNCGFPNRKSDRHCMYCRNSLLEKGGFFSWIKETYYILRWRWQLKHRRDLIDGQSRDYLGVLKYLGYFIVGIALSSTGLYLFSEAVAQGSFSSGLVASLFLYYGVLSLKLLFLSK